MIVRAYLHACMSVLLSIRGSQWVHGHAERTFDADLYWKDSAGQKPPAGILNKKRVAVYTVKYNIATVHGTSQYTVQYILVQQCSRIQYSAVGRVQYGTILCSTV